MTAIVPVPKIDIAIRVATMSDIPFMDRLQKKYGKALGYFPTQQFVGYVESGGVLVAEGNVKHEDMKHEDAPSSCFMSSCFTQPLGYVISRDRYLKRDELGVVFQLCVEPGTQRKLVGAALVREVFARSAYGCRLYCCWCAQDLEANRFWESMGFLPIAFRTGSDRKRRVHIFWQRRIVEGDVTTPYWYPSLTNQGAIREDRLVFPIPPGMHWSEVRAVEVARASRPCLGEDMGETPMPQTPVPQKPTVMRRQFGPPPAGPAKDAVVVRPTIGKPKRPKKPKPEIDPKHVAAARELRDKYLERFNQADAAMLPQGKYDVCRLEGEEGRKARIEDGVSRMEKDAPSSIPSTYSGQALYLPSSPSDTPSSSAEPKAA